MQWLLCADKDGAQRGTVYRHQQHWCMTLPKACMSFIKDVSVSAGHGAMLHGVTRFIIVPDNFRSVGS